LIVLVEEECVKEIARVTEVARVKGGRLVRGRLVREVKLVRGGHAN
jgi:hypothetical protein